jgi:hypothetical protein
MNLSEISSFRLIMKIVKKKQNKENARINMPKLSKL